MLARDERSFGRLLAAMLILASVISFQLVAARAADASFTAGSNPGAAGNAVVSLTFDDSNEDQYTYSLPALESHNMVGTFYTITGRANNLPNYLTLPQLQQIYNAGNEIGGHTVLHPVDMTQLTADEDTREICNSRNTLLNWGFPVTTFAYPHSVRSAQIEQEVAQCGFNAARYDGDIKSPDGCYTGCPSSESIPPASLYATRASDSVTDQWSLQDMESVVTQAETDAQGGNGGGWAIMVFHHFCDNDCDQYSVTPALFNQFLDWLQNQPVSIQTVGQVIGGPVQPAVQAPAPPPPAPAGQNGVTNPSLETADSFTSGLPYCWQQSTSGTNDASYSLTSNAHSGAVASQITVNNFTSGAARLVIKQDLGQCAPSVTAGDTYQVQGYYQSSSPTRFVLWYRDSIGGWHYWTQSEQFPASAAWTQASWVPPTVPDGATAVSFGMDIEGTGTLTTDDYSLADVTGTPPPSVTLTSPTGGSSVSGSVGLTSTASSPVGISRVDYMVNGTTVASSTAPPFSANWDSTTLGDGPVTVTARATDAFGNTTTSSPVSVTISNARSRNGNMLANASLESYSSGGTTPDCWQQASSGTNTATWAKSSSAHTGSGAENVTISAYTGGSRTLLTSQKQAACSPRVNPGDAYYMSAWYTSTASTRFVAYYQTSSGSWQFWTQSPLFSPASAWTQATWTLPAVPSGATALSVGLTLAATGSLTTDDYSLVDTTGVAPPSVALTSPAGGSTVSGTVTLSSTTSSSFGISRVDYQVNGATVASSTTPPFSSNWDSTTMADGPVTVTARATDMVGNMTSSSPVSVTISNAGSHNGNMLVNPSLESYPSGSSTPDCWQQGSSGTNTATWTKSSSAHTGSWAENVTISAYTSGSRTLLTSQKQAGCSPSVNPGDVYYLSAWYTSTASTRFVAYYQTSSGSWQFWTQSPQFAAASAWTQATWTPPAVPSGATALSVGLTLASTGSLTTDDYSLVDTTGVAPPSVALTSPADRSTASGAVTFAANTSSPVGISRVDYLVNGTTVASSMAPPFSSNWNSTTLGDGPVAVTARATDTLGNTTTSSPVSVTISNAGSRSGNMVANASLESYSSASSTPDCWQQGSSGTNTATWTQSSSAHTGSWAENVTISSYTSGSRTLLTSQKQAACSPRVNPGLIYNLSAWYNSTASTRFVLYYLTSSGSWQFWTQSPLVSAASAWTQATWTTPAVPSAATAVSFGLTLASTGSLTTDDYFMGTNAPTTTTSAASSVSYNAATLNGSVNPNGLSTNVHFEYGLNTQYGSSTPTQSAGSGSTAVSMNAPVSGLSATTLYHFRVVAGNSAGTTYGSDQTFTTAADITPPGSTASSPTYSTGASWSVSYTASDNGGGDNVTGVDLYARGPNDSAYTKIASDTSGGASGSFSYTAPEGDGSYRFYTLATDQAGNVQATPTNPQATTVLDTAAPTSKASGPSTASAGGSVSVSYTASDGSGSGLATVDLYARAPGQSGYSKVSSDTSGSASGRFSYTLSAGAGTYSFYTLATDKAGNMQAAPSTPDTSTNAVGGPALVSVVAGAGQSATVGSGFSSPLVALVTDTAGNPVSGVSVTFTAPGSGASGTFANGSTTTTAITGSDGQATASTFTANSTAGAYSVNATASGTSSASYNLTNTAGAPASVSVVSGDGQSATVGSGFSGPLVALVKDAAGNAVSGASVTFTAPGSGASGTFADGSTSNTATTGSEGQATASAFTANSTAGAYSVSASASGTSSASYNLTNLAGASATVSVVSGDGQSATVGSAFSSPLVALVKDAAGNPVSGVSVTFTAPGSGASGTFANGSTTTTATTGSDGQATASAFTANTTAGAYTVSATVSGASSASFNLTNTAGAPSSVSVVSGDGQSTTVGSAFSNPLVALVTDAAGNPVSGVTVTFTAPDSGASGSFANDGSTSTAATTGSDGQATASAFTANSTAGPYSVSASANGASLAGFGLTNTPGP